MSDARTTVVYAYDRAHPEKVREAAEQGRRAARNTNRDLSKKARKIRNLLTKKVKPKDIAAAVDCGTSTVYRELKKMRNEQ